MTKRKERPDYLMHHTWDKGADYRTVMVYIGRRQFQALSTIAWLVSGVVVMVAGWFVFWIVRG